MIQTQDKTELSGASSHKEEAELRGPSEATGSRSWIPTRTEDSPVLAPPALRDVCGSFCRLGRVVLLTRFRSSIIAIVELTMKADQSLSIILRQLKQPFHRSYQGVSRFRPISHLSAFYQATIHQRPLALAIQHRYPISSFQSRLSSTSTPSAPLSVPTSTNESSSAPKGPPSYELTFTCKPCRHRSTHRVTQRGYSRGTVLITCPSCHNRHVFADHLKIFADKSFTIEDLMREKGELVKRGTLEGDLEFWDGGTQTERQKTSASENKAT